MITIQKVSDVGCINYYALIFFLPIVCVRDIHVNAIRNVAAQTVGCGFGKLGKDL